MQLINFLLNLIWPEPSYRTDRPQKSVISNKRAGIYPHPLRPVLKRKKFSKKKK